MNQPPTLLSYLNVALPAASVPLIGVFAGCGAGPSLVDSSLQVLQATGQALGIEFRIERGGAIGEDSVRHGAPPLSEEAISFCADIFNRGGAVLSGPAGGRYVYDLRRRFDLFCKFVPVQPIHALDRAGVLRPGHLEGVDILIIRDNTGGVYQGTWNEEAAAGGRVAVHCFKYQEDEVRRLGEIAARAATRRRGTLHAIVKDGGIPAITALWRDVCTAAARAYGVRVEFINVDFAAYELIRSPLRFDVIVAPNLCGDILADAAGLLVSSRGVTFSGNFGANGRAVYQTNHGCAHNLRDTDTANPGGQILSLAMLLRESFALTGAAALIESSLERVWSQGWRTSDLAEPGSRAIGTREFVERVVDQVLRTPEGEVDARYVALG